MLLICLKHFTTNARRSITFYGFREKIPDIRVISSKIFPVRQPDGPSVRLQTDIYHRYAFNPAVYLSKE
jgi:hypothetical protein